MKLRLLITPGFVLIGLLAGFSVSGAHAASLSVESAAAFTGENGLRISIGDTNPGFVTDNSPDEVEAYELRFYINVENLAMGAGESFDLLHLLDGTSGLEARLAIVEDAGQIELRYAVHHTGDLGATTLIDENASLEGGWRAVYLAWEAGLGTGTFALSVGEQVLTGLSGLDNDGSEIGEVRWGAVTGLDGGTSGSFDLDDFESRAEGLIAPPFLRLGNIATRLFVGTDDNIGIAGFIIAGDTEKTVLIRGNGPSLEPFGIANFLADPTLELYRGQVSQVFNDDWADSQQAEIEATGLEPSDASEAAILTTLQPGPYTAFLAGAGETTGVGIIEVFDVDETGAPTELYNIATRGRVQTGDEVMIAGFIVEGPTPETLLIRGIGPSLSNFGVPGALNDPVLAIFEDQTEIAQNDDWRDDDQATIEATDMQPSNSRESAIVITLDPGSYTAILRGRFNGTGVGLIEVFNIDN